MHNNFQQNISNEEIKNLPTARFQGDIIVVDSEPAIWDAIGDLSRQTMIGFDTETKPKFKPGPLNKVALLQLSTNERCYLFRLNKIALAKEIANLLNNQEILKIGADIKADIKALQQWERFIPKRFVDLQTIISQWGVEEKSVRKMSAIVLNERVSKAQRLSNWESQSLTEAQKSYAATDAWVCLEVYKKLQRTTKKPLVKDIAKEVNENDPKE